MAQEYGWLNNNAGDDSKYLYNGKELNNDHGLGLYDGVYPEQGRGRARWYDGAIGRWCGVDALASAMPSWSSYCYTFDNPLRFIDPDGSVPEDIVYFNRKGTEVGRNPSDTEFKTYVSKESGNMGPYPIGSGHSEHWEEAPMPGVIEGYESPEFQHLNYQIAASTAIMNDKLESKMGLPSTENHRFTDESETPSLDVNLIKSIIMQESKMGNDEGGNGTASSDPMQANYPGDFENSKDVKEAVGLTKDMIMSPGSSINAGLGIFVLKGMNSDARGNYTTWKGDKTALQNYNGGGNPNYVKQVSKYFKSIKPATKENYVEE